MKKTLLVACIALLAILASAVVGLAGAKHPGGDSIPPESVYQLDVSLENEDGKSIAFNQFSGHPVLVTMFYTNCPHVCPLLINTIKVTETKLSESERAQIRVLAVSVDPERDTPEALKNTMLLHSVDADRWTMTRSKPSDLRSIAGVLGVRYKKLPNGEFNHSSKIVLLDRNGVQIAETSKLGKSDPDFISAIKDAIR